MSHYYLDASALVKRYVDETGSEWLRSLIVPVPDSFRFISRMTIVEVISAFARRVRDGSLSRQEFVAARTAFQDDCLYEYWTMAPTFPVVNLACAVLERYPIRAYDATHLATALIAWRYLDSRTASSLVFVSADDRLNLAAAAEGLETDNPNHHP